MKALRARDVMNRRLRTCMPSDTLAKAVELMRDHSLGFLPVVDGEDGLVVGVITDRDICLAAVEREGTLVAIAVAGAMHTNVQTCRPDQSVDDVLALMRSFRVRRVPVVGEKGRLKGVVALSDLARRAAAQGDPRPKVVAGTYAAIYEPRAADHYA